MNEHNSSTHTVARGLQAADFDALEPARFAPGQMFASRYRIVSLLGRGGMGEVYRADDLKLGQRVAVKLLPLQPAHLPGAIDRFVTEVRLARRIAHPNVCRVYDIGEADGWHYLSMEYVDGETLASLLRRIGRLPIEKAVDISRQLCAGLSAAHQSGVLHRDLKPANVMVDGRGYVRIMDFGLAVRSDGPTVHEFAGTPGYMAPEQLAGGRVTERSDLYALGLVLYELFSGRRFVPGDGYPSQVDPRIGAAIDLCVAADPAKRPASASAVAALLPGMDQIAAAVADGRVLSPNMIAAAGADGRLRPPIAWALLLAALAGIVLVAAQAHRVTVSPDDLPKSPEALAEHCREILRDVGYSTRAIDDEFWFTSHSGAPLPIRFTYRQSDRYLIPRNLFHLVTDDDPPSESAGMATVTLAPDGRLVSFKASIDTAALHKPGNPGADWVKLFTAAGLDYAGFVAVEPDRIPAVPHDALLGWQRRDGASPAAHVTAAALGGAPVLFEVTDGGDQRDAFRDVLNSRRSAGTEALLSVFIILAFIAAGVLARRHLRNREGDRNGARKLAAFIALGGVLMTLMRAHHVPVALAEWTLLLGSTGWALVWAAFSWLTYIGLEPYVRRQWPSTLISWTRALAGRLRDPLVGRDVLVGVIAGSALVLILIVRFRLANSMAPDVYAGSALEALRSPRRLLSALAFNVTDALEFALGGLFLLVLVRLAVRNTWIAASVWVWLVMPVSAGIPLNTGSAFFFGLDIVFSLVLGTLGAAILLRFGPLAGFVMVTVANLATRMPLTLDATAWYLESSIAVLLVLFTLSVYGFVVAVGSRPAFGERAAEHAVRPV